MTTRTKALIPVGFIPLPWATGTVAWIPQKASPE